MIVKIVKPTEYWEVFRAYRQKGEDKCENKRKEPEHYNLGRFDPKDRHLGTAMLGALAFGDVRHLEYTCARKGNTQGIKEVKFKPNRGGFAIA